MALGTFSRTYIFRHNPSVNTLHSPSAESLPAPSHYRNTAKRVRFSLTSTRDACCTSAHIYAHASAPTHAPTHAPTSLPIPFPTLCSITQQPARSKLSQPNHLATLHFSTLSPILNCPIPPNTSTHQHSLVSVLTANKPRPELQVSEPQMRIRDGLPEGTNQRCGVFPCMSGD
jgi:hypothetical protein